MPLSFRRVAILLHAILVFVTGCNRASPTPIPSSDKPNSVPASIDRLKTYQVVREDADKTIVMPGTIEGFESADLYAKIGGYLEWINVDIGDQIRGPQRNAKGEIIEQGQALAKLYVPEMTKQLAQKIALVEQAKAHVAQAQARLKQASIRKKEKIAQKNYRQTTYDLFEKLVKENTAVKEKFDEAKFQLEMAEAELESADAEINTAKANVQAAQANLEVAQKDLEYFRTLLNYSTIYAPFDGVVVRRWVHPGVYIKPAEGNSSADKIVTVTRIDKLRIIISVPMSQVRWLDDNDPVTIRVESLPGITFDAQVARYAPALDTKSRMMRVELELKDPAVLKKYKIFPGSYVNASLTLVRYKDKPVIPASALREGKYVFVADDGVWRRREVSVLYTDGAKVWIGDGLKGGETIVSAGSVADGQKVQ
ncbi:MAG: hemolysin D [Gemmatales bacterium]|nr:MAG: hemolysin D [Gemmatales bacterium]